jgi:hypothetical protein
MSLAGANLESLLARQTAVSLAVQALIERLLVTGKLDPADLISMREFGLQLADGLRMDGNSAVQIAGERVEEEVRAFWDPLGVPARMGRPVSR